MRIRMIVLPAVALAAAYLFWKTSTPPDLTPALTWRIGTGTEIEQGHNYDDLAAETPIRASFKLLEPRHVYLFSFSAEDGTVVMFPSSAIRSDCSNPLPAGRTVLPGKRKDQEIAWHTRAGIQAVTTYIAVVSSEKVDELEQLLPKLRMWSNTVFPDESMSVTKPGGDVKLTGNAHEPLPSELLRIAADIGNAEPNPNGPMKPVPGHPGLFMSSWKIRERKTPGGDMPGDDQPKVPVLPGAKPPAKK